MQEAQVLTDGEYHQLWNSLQQHEGHTCTRQCEFKQVFGNMFLCTSSGQSHVCDQNCTQRIWYDNHHDICRLSRRIFPRNEAPMAEFARKRSGDEVMVSPICAKRTLSADIMLQQQLGISTQAVVQHSQHSHGQPFLGPDAWQMPPPQHSAPQGWAF